MYTDSYKDNQASNQKRHWHHQLRSEVETLLESSESNGLDIAEIENRRLLVGVALMVPAQIFFTYSSIMNQLFGNAPLGSTEWALILIGGLFIYGVS